MNPIIRLLLSFFVLSGFVFSQTGTDILRPSTSTTCTKSGVSGQGAGGAGCSNPGYAWDNNQGTSASVSASGGEGEPSMFPNYYGQTATVTWGIRGFPSPQHSYTSLVLKYTCYVDTYTGNNGAGGNASVGAVYSGGSAVLTCDGSLRSLGIPASVNTSTVEIDLSAEGGGDNMTYNPPYLCYPEGCPADPGAGYAYLYEAWLEGTYNTNTPPNGWIDTPNPNGSTAFTRYQSVTFVGWASDDQGQVPTIQVRIDGGAWQNVTRRTLRTDVTSSYNAGWEWDWNVGTTSTGTHNVQAQACDSLNACTVLNPGTVNFAINAEPVPSAPTSYSAISNSDGSWISLSWANPSSSYYFAYTYVRACDRSANSTCVPTDVWSGSPKTSHTYTTSACRTYAFQIGAVNHDYAGNWTPVFTQATSCVPSVLQITPTSGPVGTSVTITGTNFGATQGSSTVKFNGTTAVPTSWSNTQIIAPVPSAATTGSIVVATSGGQATGATTFTVTIPDVPPITNLSPNSGPVGTSVTITGAGFGVTQGSSTVKFNGVTATSSSWGDNSIVVLVPTGLPAGKATVVVSVSGQSSIGASFSVTPQISGLSLTSGPPRMGFVIAGSNFGMTQGTSVVKLGTTPITSVVSWNDSSIVVQVPTAASTGNVMVTVNGASSNGVNFTVVAPFSCQ
jgi:hypothetical protein